MSEKYRTDSDGLCFVGFSVVGWITKSNTRKYLSEGWNTVGKNKNLKLYCYCIMPSHVHFITYSENGQLSGTLGDMKSFAAKQLLKAIIENPQESRKEWMLHQFEYYGKNSPQKKDMQFWKHGFEELR